MKTDADIDYTNQVFFCERSDYFKALIKNHFGENEISDNCNPMI
jgi:hypothetical protein